jgi:hypothetical protein
MPRSLNETGETVESGEEATPSVTIRAHATGADVEGTDSSPLA